MPTVTPTETQVAAQAGDRFAASLRGFGPLGLLAILVIAASTLAPLPITPVLVLLWTKWSRTPWREIGYVRPKSWIGSFVIGIVFGSAFKVLMKALMMPLLGADPINRAYQYLVGNTAALPSIVAAVIIGAGWGEETVYRGYLFERLGKLLGSGMAARTVIVLVTAGLFAAAHYSGQGVAGVEQAAVTGLVFGAIFAVTGRLWMVMCAHAAFDLMAVAIIYCNVEAKVAHLIFK